MDWPATVPLADLRRVHADYDADRIAKHSALYTGGRAFEPFKERLLDRREVERADTRLRDARLARARYTPHLSILDVLVASAFVDEPRFEGAPYYEALNDATDDDGTDLAQLARQLLYDLLLHGRAWLGLHWPLDGNAREPQWRRLPIAAVTNWTDDQVCLHVLADARASVLAEPDVRERWHIVTDEDCVAYEKRKNAAGLEAGVLVSELSASHLFGALPVYQVRLSHAGMHLLDKLEPLAVACFNTEADLAWHLHQSAHAQPVLKTERTVTEVLNSEAHAMLLRPGDDYELVACPQAPGQDLQAQIERLRLSISRAVHGVALEAAARTQAPRQGAFAAAAQRSPMDALLASYIAPIRDVLERAARDLAEFRNESTPPELEGFASFGSGLLEMALAVGQGTPPRDSRAAGSDTPAQDESVAKE